MTTDRTLNSNDLAIFSIQYLERRLSAFERLVKLLILEQRRTLMKSFTEFQSACNSLIWMFCSRRTDSEQNKSYP